MTNFLKNNELELSKFIFEHEVADQKFSELLNQVSKSIFRLKILDDVFEDKLTKLGTEVTPNLSLALKYLVSSSKKAAGLESNESATVITCVKKDSDFDYQCADAIRLSKANKGSGKADGVHLANDIVRNIQHNEVIEKVVVTAPGFMNFSLKESYLCSFCSDIVVNGVRPPGVKRRKVIVDFSSPNIAKEMHVGHLRSTILGESMCRIFEYVGFDVLRLSHVGDWGTQFGMLIAHLQDAYPDYVTKIPPITDLQVFYQESKKRFDDDSTFRDRSHHIVTDLQNGTDKNVRKAWEQICEISRRDIDQIYRRLNVTVIERGESFYQDRMVTMVKELEKTDKVKVENGCLVAHVPGFKVPLLLVKSDGGFTYDTSDMATIQQRMVDEKADWVIYVVDIGQRDHFHTFFKFASMLGWFNEDVNRIEHIGFGVVLGADKKKFKTRSGDLVKLTELLDESVTRAMTKLKERGMEKTFSAEELQKIAEAVGYSCVIYYDLSHNLVCDYEFSYDRMLDDRGNTAVYLIYTYARLRSIIRKTMVTEAQIVEHAKSNGIKIEHANEKKLLRKLVHFPEIVHRIVYETYPHYLCEYLYELASTATEFYDSCPILLASTGGVNMNRLCQVHAVTMVIKKCFDLIAITPLERM